MNENKPLEVIILETSKWGSFSDYLSILAILVSLSAVYFAFKQYKLGLKTVEAGYYLSLVQDILATKLPEARRYLEFDTNNNLTEGYMKLADIITEFRKRIQYFYFQDSCFYKELDEQLIRIDDALIVMAERKNVSKQDQNKFFVNLDSEIKDVYKKLLHKHTGK